MSGMFSILARGIKGLSRAAVNADPVDEHDLRRRRHTCANCTAATRTKHLGRIDLKVLSATSTCTVCKCNLHAKTKLADETCPLGKW